MSSDVPESYDPSVFKRPSVTVDVAIFSLVEEDLQILLVKRTERPFAGVWALPGTFVGIDESLEVREKLREKLKLKCSRLEEIGMNSFNETNGLKEHVYNVIVNFENLSVEEEVKERRSRLWWQMLKS